METETHLHLVDRLEDLHLFSDGNDLFDLITHVPIKTDHLPGNLSLGFDINHPVIRYFENLLLKNRQHYKNSFLVFKNNKYSTIQTQNIAFFFINNDTPTIMSFDKERYPITHCLDDVNKLVAPDKFFRINRQFLISFDAIKEVEHYFSRKLIVKLVFSNQEKLLVGKEKAISFLNWLENR